MKRLTLNLSDTSLESKEAVWGPAPSSPTPPLPSSSSSFSKSQLSLNIKTPPDNNLKVDLTTPRDDDHHDNDKHHQLPPPPSSSLSSSLKGSSTPRKVITHLDNTPITIISSYGIQIKAILSVLSDVSASSSSSSSSSSSVSINWRVYPSTVGCELVYLKTIDIIDNNSNSDSSSSSSSSSSSDTRLRLVFVDFELLLDFDTIDTCNNVYKLLIKLLKEQHDKELSLSSSSSSLFSSEKTLKTDAYNVAIKQEKLLQLIQVLKIKDGCMQVDKIITKSIQNLIKRALNIWTNAVYEINKLKMIQDKDRWRLHAVSNQEMDLQAWYHAIFYQEVYRLRGPFWHRDAVLPQYRQSYDLVDNALSPLEEAALAHVLCSPDTSYGDVAGQMFVVQQIASKQTLYALFQKLSSQGAQVIKYPRAGRPARKVFRFSFVEGKIYLTWKGKFGNQGVGLNEVTKVEGGITTDVLKRAAAPGKANLFLSLTCAGRSVDLCFDTEEERNEWQELLHLLMLKEHGSLETLKVEQPPAEKLNEWLYLYSALGENCLPLDVWKTLTQKSKEK